MEMTTLIPLRWHRKKDGAVFPVEISGCYFEFRIAQLLAGSLDGHGSPNGHTAIG
jgi:hypothetical protein